ncbi:MAG: glycosyltransferase family 4 protein [Chloroflexi bacterium]|nr:MAG: glycosyltransferase family 4 protein [Chloroflexota bacterium]
MLPEVEFRLTGDPARLSESVRRNAPPNAIFTGFLRYPEFLGELLSADVVAVFTTDPDIMNRAAFEAIGLGRPLVLSDLPKLRARFGQAALLCGNAPEEMAEAIRCAQRDHDDLAQRSTTLQRRLRAQHETAIARLASLLA